MCPVTVVSAQRWKLGQLKPGDTVRFVPVRSEQTASPAVTGAARRAHIVEVLSPGGDEDAGVLATGYTRDGATTVTYRRSGDDNVLVEYGDMALDLALRARVHALAERIDAEKPSGLIDLTPGIRSLQVKVNPDVLPQHKLLDWLTECESQLPAADDLVVPSRIVELPLSWDDPATREAIERYMLGVRSDAPWCPWNIEFIRRMNGLNSVDDVYRTVFDASYLVLGLGDVYLGAPVAVPLDPRHRLVTTKVQPGPHLDAGECRRNRRGHICACTGWKPGRISVRRPHHPGMEPSASVADTRVRPENPWLLRFFDQIRWYPVGADELLDMRADVAAGRGNAMQFTDTTFSLAEHQRFLDSNAGDIADKRTLMEQARAEERRRWSLQGEFASGGTTTESATVEPREEKVA